MGEQRPSAGVRRRRSRLHSEEEDNLFDFLRSGSAAAAGTNGGSGQQQSSMGAAGQHDPLQLDQPPTVPERFKRGLGGLPGIKTARIT